MYICYVDESGHCGEKYNPEQPVEVLFGALIDLTKLSKAQREHGEYIQLFTEHNFPILEFKASDMYRGANEFDGFPPDLRDAIFELLLSWGKSRKCQYFVAPIDSKRHFTLKDQSNHIAKKFGCPFEAGAMNITLAIQRLQKSKKKNKGRTFIVFDQQNKHYDNFIKLFENALEFTDTYTGYIFKDKIERLNQIIDVPLFSKSHLATMIQLADMGAFIVRKYVDLILFDVEERFEGELDKITRWYQKLGEQIVSHTHINPNNMGDPLCEYYQLIRPDGWSAKDWVVSREKPEENNGKVNK